MARRRKIQPEPDPEYRPPSQPAPPPADVATGPAQAAFETPEPAERYTTRESFRRDMLDFIGEAARTGAVAIEGGALDGIEVLSLGKIEELLGIVAELPIPPVSDRYAEIRTPATVYVDAFCPRCFLPGQMVMTVGAELRVDSEKAELRLKAKASGRPHSCGQLVLATVVEAQASIDDAIAEAQDIIDAVVTDTAAADEPQTDDAPSEPEPCPFPGCTLYAEHDSGHLIDEALLP